MDVRVGPIKKAERQRIVAYELWCWRRLSRVSQTARRANQSILKEISPECSLEGLMLKLKLQYFGYLTWRTDSLEKTLMLGKIEGRRRRGWQRMRWLDGITDSMDMSLSMLWVGDGQGSLVCCSPWGCKELDMTEQLNWTELLTGDVSRAVVLNSVDFAPGDIWQCLETFFSCHNWGRCMCCWCVVSRS